MSHDIVLNVEAGLTAEEEALLRTLLYDAFGEFITARSGGVVYSEGIDSALAYVKKRYPNMGVVESQRKAEEVMACKNLARKLRTAASDVRTFVPVRERTCEVLPLVHDENPGARAALIDAIARERSSSPLVAYAEPPRRPVDTLAGLDVDVTALYVEPKLHTDEPCPECGAPLGSGAGGSGVKCTRCPYWFCY